MVQARKETSAGDDTGVSGGDAATVQVKIRVTPSLLARLQKAAAERGVAFNREIVIRLIESFAERESAREIDESVNKLRDMVLRISAMHRESLSSPSKTLVRKKITGKKAYAKKIERKRYRYSNANITLKKNADG